MSLSRLVYYSGLLAAWGAFLAWAFSEAFILGRLPFDVMLTASAVGGIIAFAVSLAGRLAGTTTMRAIAQAAPSLLGGALGGALAGVLGNVAYGLGLPRGIGWLVMGAGIGAVDGLCDSSLSKTRNGLIGGAVGGLIGGLVFDPIQTLVGSSSGMSSRATAFVVLGAAIGCGIGLAQVVLRNAWLTVVDGYRPGRQLILSRPTTTLGSAEHLPMPFRGPLATGIAPAHLDIKRLPDGRFSAEPVAQGNHVLVNHKAVVMPTQLKDGDIIHIGNNIVRFSEKLQSLPPAAGQSIPLQTPPTKSPQTPPPPPPISPPPPRRPLTRSQHTDRSPSRLGTAAHARTAPKTPQVSAKTPPPPPPPPTRK